jgi:hypothetical protein
MKIQDKQDCQMTIRRIQELLNCGIFNPDNSGHVLLYAAYINLMICLRDLLHKTEQYAHRVSFVDDVQVNPFVKDVTDAITAHRDACCHINSFKQLFDDRGNRGSFIVGYGKFILMKVDDVELRCDYEDDTAVFFGTNRLYMRRHVVRAFEEACILLAPLLENDA